LIDDDVKEQREKKKEADKIRAMADRIAELEKQLATGKEEVIEIDPAVAAARETVWWQLHASFPAEWNDLPRCDVNPKMNEEKADTEVHFFCLICLLALAASCFTAGNGARASGDEAVLRIPGGDGVVLSLRTQWLVLESAQ
jgi:predicted phage tail protein